MKKLLLSLMSMLPLLAFGQTFDIDMSKSQPVYSDATGYGYDITGVPKKGSKSPYYFSFKVPDGNYKVSVTFGTKKRSSNTTLRAECRRLLAENVVTAKGKTKTMDFVVNKRSPKFVMMTKDGEKEMRVSLKEREKGYLHWDDKLTLEVTGESPAITSIKVTPDTTATTVFLCGNSTVVDQPNEPYASWGQMIPRWFDSSVCISNHAESGLTARTFINGHRLDKILSMIRPGDYVICEFGHNDEKEKYDGDGAWYHYVYQLKIFVDKVKKAGGNIIFCTPTQRRRFDDSKTTIVNTHGEFPAAMKSVAEREGVPVIDINGMTKTFFETLGYDNSTKALVFYPAGKYGERELADNTHFNPFGAYEVSKMVVMGMKKLNLPLVDHLRGDWVDFSPSAPDDYTTFKWYDSATVDATKPDGN